MFGQTRSCYSITLLVFIFIGLLESSCNREDSEPLPCECTIMHESGLTLPPKEETDTENNCTAHEIPVCPSYPACPAQKCPPTAECPTPPDPPECPTDCSDSFDCPEETGPDARDCFAGSGSYPIDEDQVALTPMNLDIEWTCSAFSSGIWTFRADEGHSLEFFLLPTPDLFYCVEITLEGGEITLDVVEGEVTANEDGTHFTWCMERFSDDFGALGEEDIPATLNVVSLEGTSRFKVKLERGE